ncbi:MAG: ATP-binding cassette domain-containing protein [Acidobacteriia bacterium]|nr:ATP-binding cassette domain-containing protein [Terriglobia bacterium]
MRRWLVPEVVQSSGMDCGPASLKALLEGFGISASYGRLREACQTDVDGSSIDQIEETAISLGLRAEQVMMPVDHVLLGSAKALPALVVVRLPGGATHFVVAWSRLGPWIQVMDPAVGRRWSTVEQFQSEIFVHTQAVPADAWREWAGSAAFLVPLRQRIDRLGLPVAARDSLIDAARSDSGWSALATLDAAVRMLAALTRSRGVRKGPEAAQLLVSLTASPARVPSRYWSVQPDPDAADQLLLSGAVLLQVHGRRAEPVRAADLSPELAAALEEAPARPGLELWRILRADGLLAPVVLGAALALAAGAVLCEALLFRGLLDLGRDLALSGQRVWALGATVVLLAGLLLLDWPLALGVLRLSRKLECRLRLAFLRKIPRLTDRYFQSRLISDMAERSHSVHQLRDVPDLGAQFLRATFEMIATVAAIAWLYPASAPLAALAAAVAWSIPLFAQPVLGAADLRVRNHTGALSRFYFDALLGVTALRAHGAERPVCREHNDLLTEWARAGLDLQRTLVRVEALQLFLGMGLAAWLMLRYLSGAGDLGGVLLLAYWSLNLPMLGQDAATAAWQYPRVRNITLRLMEPLGAPEEAHAAAPLEVPQTRGMAIQMEAVSVRAAGHSILEDIDLEIPPGSHVGIVGSSGAGKSSLVGLLLGWHRPASGVLRVDGEPLDAARLQQLRDTAAWVDPQIQLWNRSLFDNLRYGAPADAALDLETVLDAADLRGVLHKLPDGLQSALGEGGALVSGGEGQRVRAGRALLRRDPRLVILDEPGRGLDRESRRALLSRCREAWREATLLCITHDVAETRQFPRVLVIDQGRVVEDGAPDRLAADSASRYRALLDAEERVRQTLWSHRIWRRLTLHDGVLLEKEARTASWHGD